MSNLIWQDKLSAARLRAINPKTGGWPWMRAALFTLIVRETRGLGTLAVTHDSIMLVDPTFVDAVSVEELAAVLLHEVSHVLRDHHARAKSVSAEPSRWNVAADGEINDDLVEAGFKLPGSPVLPEKFPAPNGLTAEEYYGLLGKQDQDDPQDDDGDDDGDGGGAGQSGDDGDDDDSEGGTGESGGGKSDDGDQDGDQGGGQGGDGDDGDGGDGDQDGGGDGGDGGDSGDADGQGKGSGQGQGAGQDGAGDGDGAGGAGGADGDGEGAGDGGEGSGGASPGRAPHRHTNRHGSPTPKAAHGNCGSCAGGAPIEGEEEAREEVGGGRTTAEQKRLKKQVAEAIRDAAQRGRGNVPGGWAVWADAELQPPHIPWQQKLARACRKYVARRSGAVDMGYHKPSRRQAGVGFGAGRAVMPAYFAPVPKVEIDVDTSGSMGAAERNRAASEAGAIVKAVGGEVDFVAVDCVEQTRVKVRNPQDIITAMAGGGGTDFRPPFETIKKMPAIKQPNIVVFITDGMGPCPAAPPPGVDVIWVLVGPCRQKPYMVDAGDDCYHSDRACNWGEFIEVDDDGEKRIGDAA